MTAATGPAELFRRTFDTPPSGVWSSPGRVNLIGEHTDYNSGLVMPFAIDARATVAVALTDTGLVEVVSAQQDSVVHSAPVADLAPGGTGSVGWPAYLNGVVWGLVQRGVTVPGVRIALDSTVPSGAGLSSSAAIECATALALADLLELGLGRGDVARVAQQAENDFVGMPCGLMDQMASAACTAGHLLFFDVGADRIDQVPFDTAVEGLAVLVIDTKVKHALTDGEYAKRRASCEQAAAELGVAHLSVLTPDDLPRLEQELSSDLLVRRARHIVTENARVRSVADLLRNGSIEKIGPDLTASHASLRDDYEVSDPALDLAVEAALAAGAVGARMTGGGFGGSAITLVHVGAAQAVSAAVLAAFGDAGRTAPVIRSVSPSPGASRDPLG